jgi:hypothetical protein
MVSRIQVYLAAKDLLHTTHSRIIAQNVHIRRLLSETGNRHFLHRSYSIFS